MIAYRQKLRHFKAILARLKYLDRCVEERGARPCWIVEIDAITWMLGEIDPDGSLTAEADRGMT